MKKAQAFVEGDNLKLQISSSSPYELKTWNKMSDISSSRGQCVGEIFTLAGEDYIDEDYNDVYVSLSAWKKAE